jgi:hypothetical protein
MIAELLKDALATLATTTGESVAVFNYGDTVEFSELWKVQEDGLPSILSTIGNKRTVIIVWQDAPTFEGSTAEGLLKPHLTPIDWALAFSNVLIERNAKKKDIPGLRIHIIDLTGKEYESAWAVRMRHQLLAEMPWITLHAPLLPVNDDPAPYRENYYAILEGTGKEPALLSKSDLGWQFCSEGRLMSDSVHSGRGLGLKDLARQWAASLTQSMEHHDVNNVVGADILARPERRRVGLFGAFLTRLDWGGNDLSDASCWTSWDAFRFVKSDLFDRALCIYAVDDHLDQGWARFLCRLHGGEQFDEQSTLAKDNFTKLNAGRNPAQKVKLFGCLAPTPLIGFLKDRASFGARDYGSQITNGELCAELVFLDLRLYSSAQEARVQIRQLVDVAQTKLVGPLAWQPIDQLEIESIKKWCDGQDTVIPDEALLFLPRLLALALPLTPIVLFSSTGQAQIRDRLKPYLNIFTGFEKPRVLSDPTSIDSSLVALRQGLSKSVGMMQLRLQLAHAQRAARRAEQDNPARNKPITNQHIEIYADETERDETEKEEGSIASGLAVCLFPSINSAVELQSTLIREWKSHGIVWAKVARDPALPKLSKGTDIKRDDTECIYQSQLLATLLNTQPDHFGAQQRTLWSAVAISVRVPKSQERGVSINAFPDGPLDVALRFNLEFVLYALIPYLSCGHGKFRGTIEIHLPTRTVPKANQRFAEELCQAFDLGKPTVREGEQKWMVPTASLISGLGTAFPLVRGWLQEWPDVCNLTHLITRVKMTRLGRGTREGLFEDQAQARRLFHDVADWICSASGRIRNRATGLWVWPLNEQLKNQKLIPNWFVSTDGERQRGGTRWFEEDTRNSLALMRALRASFQRNFGELGESLSLVLENSYVASCNDRLLNNEHCSQQRVILWTLAQELDYTTGRKLHSLLAPDVRRD